MIVRRFREEDAQAVSDLVRASLLISCGKDYPPEPLEAFAATQTPAAMVRRGQTTRFYVAEEGGTPVGCAAVGRSTEVPGESCVYSFYVLPECQGRGIGRRLMEALEEDPDFRAARRVILHASRTALGFYRKMGFGFEGGDDRPDADGLYRMEMLLPPGGPPSSQKTGTPPAPADA